MAKAQQIKPLFDYIVVQAAKQEEVTASGIVLPDTVKEKPQMGKVIAVGDGVMEDGELVKNSMHIKVGQVIVYKKWGGNEVKIGNEEFLLIKQEDVMAVVE